MPPGQYATRDFPVLSAGPTQRRSLETWSFSIEGEVESPLRWSWDEFRALPSENITKDIHCVTKWSKLDTQWEGVSLDTLLQGVKPSAAFVVAYSDGDYTTACGAGSRRAGASSAPPNDGSAVGDRSWKSRYADARSSLGTFALKRLGYRLSAGRFLRGSDLRPERGTTSPRDGLYGALGSPCTVARPWTLPPFPPSSKSCRSLLHPRIS